MNDIEISKKINKFRKAQTITRGDGVKVCQVENISIKKIENDIIFITFTHKDGTPDGARL
jgi:hypothetical protein